MGRKPFTLLLVLGWIAAAPVHAADDAVAKRDAATALWQQGMAYHQAGAVDVAILHFRQSIALSPSAEAHTYLGWALAAKGQLDEAIAECRKAIPLDPEFGNPYNDIGVYLHEQGKAGEAVPWFEKAMRAKRYCCPFFPRFNLGRIRLEQGDIAGAERLFRDALALEPDYLPAREALDAIQRAAPRL